MRLSHAKATRHSVVHEHSILVQFNLQILIRRRSISVRSAVGRKDRYPCQGTANFGHLALNEPTITQTSNDPSGVRVVDIRPSNQNVQLIEDHNFKDLGYIPEKGIPLTIPLCTGRDVVTRWFPGRSSETA